MRKGNLFVLTGPSGAGKGTVLSRLMQRDDNLYFSISATTRAPREMEVHGTHYFFLTREAFEEKIKQKAFLEYAQYVDQYYGTLEAQVEEQLQKGRDVILEIEVQGAEQVKRARPDAILLFIAPPSIEELERRLRGRGTEDEDKIRKRMETAKTELSEQDTFDHIIVNREIEQAVCDVEAIIHSYRNNIEKGEKQLC